MMNATSRLVTLRVIVHGHHPQDEKTDTGKVIELPGSIEELLDVAGK